MQQSYKEEDSNLKQGIAALARKLASVTTDPSSLEAFTACRLIPLDKNPGVRPIGIGETLRRIVMKAVSWTIKDAAMDAAGSLQVAAGLESGAEAAISAMKQAFDEVDTEGVMLVDAKNAFNNMNRRVALHNIRVICPEAAIFLINIYRQPARLMIRAENEHTEISSHEGTAKVVTLVCCSTL